MNTQQVFNSHANKLFLQCVFVRCAMRGFLFLRYIYIEIEREILHAYLSHRKLKSLYKKSYLFSFFFFFPGRKMYVSNNETQKISINFPYPRLFCTSFSKNKKMCVLQIFFFFFLAIDENIECHCRTFVQTVQRLMIQKRDD